MEIGKRLDWIDCASFNFGLRMFWIGFGLPWFDPKKLCIRSRSRNFTRVKHWSQWLRWTKGWRLRWFWWNTMPPSRQLNAAGGAVFGFMRTRHHGARLTLSPLSISVSWHFEKNDYLKFPKFEPTKFHSSLTLNTTAVQRRLALILGSCINAQSQSPKAWRTQQPTQSSEEWSSFLLNLSL